MWHPASSQFRGDCLSRRLGSPKVVPLHRHLLTNLNAMATHTAVYRYQSPYQSPYPSRYPSPLGLAGVEAGC